MVDAIAPEAVDVYAVGPEGEHWIATFRVQQQAVDYCHWIFPSIAAVMPNTHLEMREP